MRYRPACSDLLPELVTALPGWFPKLRRIELQANHYMTPAARELFVALERHHLVPGHHGGYRPHSDRPDRARG